MCWRNKNNAEVNLNQTKMTLYKKIADFGNGDTSAVWEALHMQPKILDNMKFSINY